MHVVSKKNEDDIEELILVIATIFRLFTKNEKEMGVCNITQNNGD